MFEKFDKDYLLEKAKIQARLEHQATVNKALQQQLVISELKQDLIKVKKNTDEKVFNS